MKAVKPKRMWADYDVHAEPKTRLAIYATKRDQRSNRPDLEPFQVLVIPTDPASVEAMVKKVASALWRYEHTHVGSPVEGSIRGKSESALRAIGIKA